MKGTLKPSYRLPGRLGLCLALFLASGTALGQNPAAVAELETFIRAEQTRQGIPGIAMAVVSGDSVVWQQGFGIASVEAGASAAAITPETLFQIGSLTKTFTATAILNAAAAGRFDVQRPVGKYISGLFAIAFLNDGKLGERRLAVIVLTNLETSEIDPLVAKAFDAFLPAADTAQPARQIAGGKTGRIALPPAAERYIGPYTNPRRWTLEIAKNDRQLILKQFGREFPLEMIDEHRFLFQFPGREEPVQFVIGPLGKDGPVYVQFYVWAFVRGKG